MRLVFVGPPGAGQGHAGEGHLRAATGSRRSRRATCFAPRRPRASSRPISSPRWPPAASSRTRSSSGSSTSAPRSRTATSGFLLDGFPRTVPQAEALGDAARRSAVRRSTPCVALEVPRELLIERAVLRRTDKRTGQIYHLKYKPPPPDAELEHRADDHEEVVRNRLDTYEAMTAELLPYYEKRGLLRRVDGVGKRRRGHRAGALARSRLRS